MKTYRRAESILWEFDIEVKIQLQQRLCKLHHGFGILEIQVPLPSDPDRFSFSTRTT